MTEEYKKLLLGYLVGDLKIDNPKNDEIVKEIEEIPYNNWSEYLPEHKYTSDIKINGILDISENGLFVFYGGYKDKADNNRGIIILTNSNFKPIKVFTKYNNGTYLRNIYQLNIDEDNTFYGVDSTEYYYPQDGEQRFIMLNNFSSYFSQINDYIIQLKKSYFFPENCKNVNFKNIIKNPNSAHYFIVGEDINGIATIDLKINVGSSNEWNVIRENNPVDGVISYAGSYAEFDKDDNLFFEIMVSTLENANNRLKILYKDFSDTTLKTKTIQTSSTRTVIVSSSNYNNQCVFKNKNEIYFVGGNLRYVSDIEKNKFIAFYKYDIQKSELKTIYTEELGETTNYSKLCMFVVEHNNDIYVLHFKDNEDNRKYDISYFRYKDDWSPILIKEKQSIALDEIRILAISKFNLLQLCILRSNLLYLMIIKEDYNPTNYNSSSYTNDQSLNSDKVELFSDNSFVFARNLYNKSINNSTTISTVEIPNTYLNNIPINQESLLSKTNTLISNNSKKITKNIYETLYLNFVNTLGIVNKNDVNNQIRNTSASSYLNQAINTYNLYENAKMSKYRINYQDETNDTKNLIIKEKKGDSCIVEFALAVIKKIKSIEFISNDETIVYHTIDLNNLEVDKIYKISQKIEVI